MLLNGLRRNLRYVCICEQVLNDFLLWMWYFQCDVFKTHVSWIHSLLLIPHVWGSHICLYGLHVTPCGGHMVVCCILIGQPTHSSCTCSQWLSAACYLLLHGTSYNMDSNVGIILCFDFCATSDEKLLPSSGFHLLAISHMSYGVLSLYYISVIWYLWHFAAFMNLPYAEPTSGSMLDPIFELIWILRTF